MSFFARKRPADFEGNASVVNCPHCRAGDSFGRCSVFKWQMETPKSEGDRKILGDFDVYRTSIELKQTMHCGSLWECGNCGTHWFLTPDQQWMHFLAPTCVPFVLQ